MDAPAIVEPLSQACLSYLKISDTHSWKYDEIWQKKKHHIQDSGKSPSGYSGTKTWQFTLVQPRIIQDSHNFSNQICFGSGKLNNTINEQSRDECPEYPQKMEVENSVSLHQGDVLPLYICSTFLSSSQNGEFQVEITELIRTTLILARSSEAYGGSLEAKILRRCSSTKYREFQHFNLGSSTIKGQLFLTDTVWEKRIGAQENFRFVAVKSPNHIQYSFSGFPFNMILQLYLDVRIVRPCQTRIFHFVLASVDFIEVASWTMVFHYLILPNHVCNMCLAARKQNRKVV